MPNKTISLLIFASLVLTACLQSEDSPTSRSISLQRSQTASKSKKNMAEQKTSFPAGSQAREVDASTPQVITRDRKLPITEARRPDLSLPEISGTDAAINCIEEIHGFKIPAEYLTVSSKRYPNNVTVVMLPLEYNQNSASSYPMVIAFGGLGECVRPARDGALAWLQYYKADEAVLALSNNKLEISDFRGLVTRELLNSFNNRLKRNTYKGVILVCPASPPLSPQIHLESPEYETFVIQELIPALKSHYRVAPDKLGIDGVSMGGSRSMYYGFKYPKIFSSIGSVQGAFGPFFDVYRDLIAKNKNLLKGRVIQLVTSDRDTMIKSVERMHALLLAEDIPHTYLKLTGPHDYIFNQGPGALSLLVFHDNALRTATRGPTK